MGTQRTIITRRHPSARRPSQWSDADSWLRFGQAQGWASDVVCASHDGTPMTEEELDNGLCCPVVRLGGPLPPELRASSPR